jgi:uncharacterized protein (TIGR02246 family)
MRLMLTALSFVAATPALAAQPSRAADEAAIRALVRSYVDARELRSPEAVGALFTEDADQHTTTGEWRRGRAGIVPGTMRSSAANTGTRDIKVETVRFLTADAAIADGPYTITGPGTQVRRMWATLVVTRQKDGWKIAAIRNATPTGAAPP